MYKPIAIVGIGCQFPGGADSPEKYWELLKNGIDVVNDVPKERWNHAYFHSKDRTQDGGIIAEQGGFIDNVKGFDHSFFNISLNEANNMDPQQRITLQVAWQAFEQGGLSPKKWSGKSVGVFMGCFTSDYQNIQFLDPLDYNVYSSTGMMNTMLSNRLSYSFNFTGPSMSIDTACSASLTAVHQACVSLQRGESEMALAGGSLLMLLPDFQIAETKTGFLSKDSRCKSFSKDANGYVRSEGVGMVILKRLEDALAAGDTIQGVIRGSAVNQDGQTMGITLPNGDSQMEVIRTAIKNAGINPADVNYVEAHGTGTSAGDPIEAKSIGTVYRKEAKSKKPLYVGSCKSNIGHLEPAAGIAGLIKTVLCLKHNTIPKNLHSEQLNPLIPFEDLSISIPQNKHACPKSKQANIAGVNSFGFGGSNAHLIVQAADETMLNKKSKRKKKSNKLILPVSGRSKEALIQLIQKHYNLLKESKDDKIEDWCYSSSLHRSHHEFRKIFYAKNKASLLAEISKFLNASEVRINTPLIQQTNMAWVFPGLGYLTFGESNYLLENEPLFRKKFLECNKAYEAISGISILNEIKANNPELRIENQAISHPAVFFHQVSLAQLWKSRGIEPDVIVGHSAGEVSGFHIAGVYGLKDSLNILFQRIELAKNITQKGAMIAVAAGEDKISKFIESYNGTIEIAAYNSPNQLTLTGDAKSIQALNDDLNNVAIKTIFLSEQLAFHHSKMLVGLENEKKLIGIAKPKKPKIKLYTTLTGKELDLKNLSNNHFIDNIENPVLFTDAIQNILEKGSWSFLEISDNPIFGSQIQSFKPKDDAFVLNKSIENGNHDLMTLASIYETGFTLNWKAIHPTGTYVDLPAYPWQLTDCWYESEISQSRRMKPSDGPLLGTRISSGLNIWESLMSTEKIPWLNKHVILGECILPASAYVEMILSALSTVFTESSFVIEHLKLNQAVRFGVKDSFNMRLELDKQNSTIDISATKDRIGKDYFSVAKADYRIIPEGRPNKIKVLPSTELKASEELYSFFKASKYEYRGAFKGITGFINDNSSSYCTISVPDKYCNGEYGIHPVILDLALQSALACKFVDAKTPTAFEIPIEIDEVRIFSKSEPNLIARAQVLSKDEFGSVTNIMLFNTSGMPIAQISGLITQNISSQKKKLNSSTINSYLSTVAWENFLFEKEAPTREINDFVIINDRTGIANKLESLIQLRFPTANVTATNFSDKVTDKEMRIALGDFLSNSDATIINCSSIDATQLNKVSTAVCNPIIQLSKVIRSSQFKGKCWFISTNAQSIDKQSSLNPFQSALWGIARVFCNQEFKTNSGGIIDLGSIEDLNKAIDIIVKSEIENEFLIRNEQLFVPRLKAFVKPQYLAPMAFSKTYDYLVTGAFGAIGKQVVNWMVEKQARQLILTTSRPVPPKDLWPNHEEYAWVNSILEKGIKVDVIQVDLSKQSEVNSLTGQTNINNLRGVIHCAGVVADQLLDKLTKKNLNKVLGAKLNSAWNLHHLLKDVSLEHFVLFSSIASCTPNPGTGNYAAANAGIDALAKFRVQNGLPATSINWGAWSIGMVEELNLEGIFAKMGIGCLEPKEGMALLETVFNLGMTTIVSQKMDWPKFLSRTASVLPIFNYYNNQSTAQINEKTPHSLDEIKLMLIEEFSENLNIDKSEINTTDSLVSHGLDSLTAVFLSDMITKKWGVDISTHSILDGLSINEIELRIKMKNM
jgi:acyl transferase domain-containing protein/NADP-dependent 3-hydroxy acid dehydrogenase YdfG/acyl carrier protein